MAQLTFSDRYQRGLRELEIARGGVQAFRTAGNRSGERMWRRVERNIQRRKSMGGSGG